MPSSLGVILHQKEVVSATAANSVIELTTADTSFADGTSLSLQSDGSYAAFNGYKAIYYG